MNERMYGVVLLFRFPCNRNIFEMLNLSTLILIETFVQQIHRIYQSYVLVKYSKIGISLHQFPDTYICI